MPTQEVAHWLLKGVYLGMVYLHVTLAQSTGQSKSHAKLECEYLVNGER